MDQVTFDQFQKVDIRIGTVIKAEVPEWSHWVMKMTVDFGDPPAGGGEKLCFSGIMKFYKPEEMVNKQFPFVVNLIPKKVGPEKELSEVMMLMAVPFDSAQGLQPEDVKPILFDLKEPVANGTVVY